MILKKVKKDHHTHNMFLSKEVNQVNSRYVFCNFIYIPWALSESATTLRQERHWVRQEKLFVLALQGRLGDLNS